MENENKLIEFKNFVFNFPVERKHKISFDNFIISKGDFVLITGENGSGKSSLLNLFGVVPEFNSLFSKCSFEGAIYLNFDNFEKNKSLVDFNDKEKSKLSRRRCFVEQNDNYEPRSSAYSTILKDVLASINDSEFYNYTDKKGLKSKLKKTIENTFDKYIKKAISGLTYTKFKAKRYSHYSGGESKLISIVKSLIKAEIIDSKLILMDEPLNNLDAENKRIVNNMIADYRDNHPETVFLIISHCQIFHGVTKIINFESTGIDNDFVAKVMEPGIPQNCLVNKVVQVINNKYVYSKNIK